ncbi:MAG: hydroxymethylglutaryl-CoA lyase [Flavobacteriaceae bacterium]
MEKKAVQKTAITLVECPRDALQGLRTFVPTEQKIAYLQQLLKVGFPQLDCGSFVSPKAIPQMADTAEVLHALDRADSTTELLTIVANIRGVEEACAHPQVDILGYPFSISENFQMRNTHRSMAESSLLLQEIIQIVEGVGKKLVVYLSMGFGNPYGDPWSPALVFEWIQQMADWGVSCVSLSDTVGQASSDLISELLEHVYAQDLPMEVGVHLHTHPTQSYAKIHAAYRAGCRRMDGALLGYGGCPMAHDQLIGNMPTEHLLSYCNREKIPHGLNALALETAINKAKTIFDTYGEPPQKPI